MKHPLHPKLIDAISEYKTCEEAMRDAYDMGREKGHNEMINLTHKQLNIILDAVEDYSILLDEDTADDCNEIIDIIEAYLIQ
jgi:hypothetical protein